MGETWGEEAPAAVAAALPHYAQVKNMLLGPESFKLYYLSKGPIVKGFGRPNLAMKDSAISFWPFSSA